MNNKWMLLGFIFLTSLSACGAVSNDTTTVAATEDRTVEALDEEEPATESESTTLSVDDLSALLEPKASEVIIGFSEFTLKAIDGDTGAEDVVSTTEHQRLLRVGKYSADDGSTPISISFDISLCDADSGGILVDREDGTIELLSLTFPEIDGLALDGSEGMGCDPETIEALAEQPDLASVFSSAITIVDIADNSFTIMGPSGTEYLFERRN